MNWFFAIGPSDIIGPGKEIGTASNQALLGIMLVLFAMVAGWLYWRSQRLQDRHHTENKAALEALRTEHATAITILVNRLEQRENEMTAERKSRITMLLEQQKEAIEVQKDVKHAIENNTKAVADLKEFIKLQSDTIQQLIDKVIK